MVRFRPPLPKGEVQFLFPDRIVLRILWGGAIIRDTAIRIVFINNCQDISSLNVDVEVCPGFGLLNLVMIGYRRDYIEHSVASCS